MRSTALLSLVLLGCTPPVREAADRTPPTADCDVGDPTRCLLPWPSNAFTEVDASTATGLRLAVQPDSLFVQDRVDCLNRADGFSRVSGIIVGLGTAVPAEAVSWDPAPSLQADAPLQLITIQHDHPQYATRRAIRAEVYGSTFADGDQSVIIGRPAEVLPPAADHAVVLLDSIGVEATAPRSVRVALGLEKPDGEAEEARAANYAPVADALVASGVDLERVLRVSWFTTRSREDGERRMVSMVVAQRAAVADADVIIESVSWAPRAGVGAIVLGRLEGMPRFLDDEGFMVLDDAGQPVVAGERSVPFRVVLPAVPASYRVALFGHGTGGDYTDSSFDGALGAEQVAKVGIRLDGWTGDSFINTAFGFSHILEGSARSTAGLAQALSAGPAVLDALEGPLGDALSAETLDGQANPFAGVRPDVTQPAWLGGSLGGTLGPVVVGNDERVNLGVFNVPGAGWTHIIPSSYFYELGLGEVVSLSYGAEVDVQSNMAMSQTCWDEVDGAIYADRVIEGGATVLLQESLGDPVLPNLGTELLASSLGAVQIETVLEPIIGLEAVDGPVTSGAALTQFRVPDEGEYQVHGFAARNTPAGDAALGQITSFLQSAWDGAPEMAHPEGCAVTADGSCDFGESW